MNEFIFLLDGGEVSSVIVGGQQTAAGAEAGGTTASTGDGGAPPPQEAGAGGGLFSLPMILFYVAILAAMYFITIRPQRKRDKQMKELQASMKVGDNIITSAGLFGRIVSVGEDCFVVEFGTNKSIHIPVRKQDVLGVKDPILTPIPKDTVKE